MVDLPGTYSLTAYSLEELVARDFLVNERPDVVVDIVDASNLDRNLYLALLFIELGVPLVIALNMVDMAEARGIEVDEDVLSALLDVPVVPTVATSNKGLDEVLDKAIEVALSKREWKPAVISYGADIDESLKKIEDVIRKKNGYDTKYLPRWLGLKCLEGDTQILELIQGDPNTSSKINTICAKTNKHIMRTLEEEPEGIIADHRYGYITGITKKAVKRKIESRLNLSDQIDKVLTNRMMGPIIMMAFLYGIFEFTFTVSEGPVNWLGSLFALLRGSASSFLPEGHLRSLIVSGIIDGVGGVLGFVPLIMFMFFSIAIMEDSGYMARVAYMLDRVLRWFGLHGNSVMALIVSGGISRGLCGPRRDGHEDPERPEGKDCDVAGCALHELRRQVARICHVDRSLFRWEQGQNDVCLYTAFMVFCPVCRQNHAIHCAQGAQDTLCDGTSSLQASNL